jgi:predicted  nucleic acid-binding Zn-ribbon protein
VSIEISLLIEILAPIITGLLVFAVQWGLMLGYKAQIKSENESRDKAMEELGLEIESLKRELKSYQKEMSENLSTQREQLTKTQGATNSLAESFNLAMSGFKETIQRIEQSTKETLTDIKKSVDKMDSDVRGLWKQQP